MDYDQWNYLTGRIERLEKACNYLVNLLCERNLMGGHQVLEFRQILNSGSTKPPAYPEDEE